MQQFLAHDDTDWLINCFGPWHLQYLVYIYIIERPSFIIILPDPAQVLFQQGKKTGIPFHIFPGKGFFMMKAFGLFIEWQIAKFKESDGSTNIPDRHHFILVIDIGRPE